jgi:hypothetical protein
MKLCLSAEECRQKRSRISIGISSPAPSPDRDFSKQYRKEIRHFWDGGMLYNTPLTQLVVLHRNYWYRIRGLKDKVPTLNVCVINVYPIRQRRYHFICPGSDASHELS